MDEQKKHWYSRMYSPAQQVFFLDVLGSKTWWQLQWQLSRVRPEQRGMPPPFGTILKRAITSTYIELESRTFPLNHTGCCSAHCQCGRNKTKVSVVWHFQKQRLAKGSSSCAQHQQLSLCLLLKITIIYNSVGRNESLFEFSNQMVSCFLSLC